METHLSRRRVQHADVLRRDDMHQLAGLQLAYLDEVWLKRKEVRMREGKGLRPTFPIYNPVRSRPPAISIHKEGEVSVVEKEFAIEPFDRNGDDIFASDKIKRGIGVVEKRLGLKGLEAYYFEASRTSNA